MLPVQTKRTLFTSAPRQRTRDQNKIEPSQVNEAQIAVSVALIRSCKTNSEPASAAASDRKPAAGEVRNT